MPSLNAPGIMLASKFDSGNYRYQYISCVVLTHDNNLVLQYRNSSFKNFPDTLGHFGGRMETEEAPIQTLMRELKEELGASVAPDEPVKLGAFTEEATHQADLIHAFFWHDKNATITGCYEGEIRFFESVQAVIQQPKLLEGDRWMLRECSQRELI